MVDSLTGRQFENWTVLGGADRGPSGFRRWLCRCACGSESPVAQAGLLSGRSTRCRQCAQKERGKKAAEKRGRKDLKGRVFGNWTVLGFSHRNDRDVIFWLCQCACGITKPVRVHSLTDGKSSECNPCAARRRWTNRR